jgi:hypothetical protein
MGRPRTYTESKYDERECHKIAETIRNFWAARGWDVNITCGYIGSTGEEGDSRSKSHYIIRSDMVNGLPTRKRAGPIKASPQPRDGHGRRSSSRRVDGS